MPNDKDGKKIAKDDVLALPPEILEKMKVRGWKFCSSGYDDILCKEALESATRAKNTFLSKETGKERGATAAAILCATAACEARVSEYLAHWEFASGPLPADLDEIRRKTSALEQWRLLLRSQAPSYSLATSREYQHLGCLFQLRDLVAHRNARLRLVGSFPEQITDCVRQGVIPIRKLVTGEWAGSVLVFEVADWAAHTARQWLNITDKLVPLVC